MKLNSLHDLFIDQLKDIYSAEEQLVDALPTIIDAVQDTQLKQGLESHLEETREHVRRLDEVFRSIQVEPESEFCDGMKGLIDECEKCVECDAEPAVKDQGLIACAQRCEHYEIAVYGTLCAFADRMSHEQAGTLLKQTLSEEKAADEKLTEVAESLETPMGMGQGTESGAGQGRQSGGETMERGGTERSRGPERAEDTSRGGRGRGSEAASEPGGRRRAGKRESEGSRQRGGEGESEESSEA